MATINKRGNTFQIVVSLGLDTNGKKIRKTTTYKPPENTTPKKAEKLAQEFAIEFERKCRGLSSLNENMRFSELAEWYIENYARNKLKPITAYTYEGQIRNHLLPELGNMKLKDFTPAKITAFFKTRTYQPATCRKVYVILQSVFARAVDPDMRFALPYDDPFLDALYEGDDTDVKSEVFDAAGIIAKGLPYDTGKVASVGEMRKLQANYTKDRVYSKKDALGVVSRFEDADVLKPKSRANLPRRTSEIPRLSPPRRTSRSHARRHQLAPPRPPHQLAPSRFTPTPNPTPPHQLAPPRHPTPAPPPHLRNPAPLVPTLAGTSLPTHRFYRPLATPRRPSHALAHSQPRTPRLAHPSHALAHS